MIKKIVTGLIIATLTSVSALACGGNCDDMSKCADPAKCGSMGMMGMDMPTATIAKADEHAGGAVTVTNDKYKLIYKIEDDGVDYFLYEKASNKAIDPKGITGKLLTPDNEQSYNISAMAMGDEPKAHLMMMDKINAKKLTGKVIFKLPDGSRIMFDLK